MELRKMAENTIKYTMKTKHKIYLLFTSTVVSLQLTTGNFHLKPKPHQ